jgi:phasin family protein
MNLEKAIGAHKAQLVVLHEMTSKALNTLEKIAQLNLEATKRSMDSHGDHAHSLLSTKDAKELSKLHHNRLQELAEKVAAYNHDLFGIAVGLGNEFSGLVEARMAEAQEQFVSTVEATLKHVPHGAEPMMAAVKKALSTANTAMDSVQQVVKQVTDSTQVNLAAVSANAAKTGKPSSTKANK